MSLSIKETLAPDPSWTTLARERGLFYHDPRWIAQLSRAYAYPMICLTATAAGRTVGFLALAEIPRLLGPRRLVSLPFSYAAGPLAEDPETGRQLALQARELA